MNHEPTVTFEDVFNMYEAADGIVPGYAEAKRESAVLGIPIVYRDEFKLPTKGNKRNRRRKGIH